MPTKPDQKISLENIRHDTQTSLIGILGLSQSLQLQLRDSPLSVQSKELANAIAAHLRFQTALFDTLIKRELAFDVFNLKSLMEDLMALVMPQVELKEIKLSYKIDENLPLLIRGDALLLFRILYGLLTNAIKFTLRGKVDIRLRGEIKENSILMLQGEVSDTGRGIAVSDKDFIFERYYRGVSDQVGTGIGLSQVKQDINALNGKLDVESQIGKGSTFFFSVPMHFENEMPSPKAIRALLIEDHPVTVAMIQDQFDKMGWHCDIAMNAQSALRLINQNTFDFIAMDLHLPDTSSDLLLSSIRAINRLVPIIGITASYDNLAQYPDIAIVLEKPISEDGWLGALRSVGIE